MKALTRRQMLIAAMPASAAVLAACQGGMTSQQAILVTQAVVNDLSQMATGFSVSLPALQALNPPALSASKLQTITADTTQFQKLASQVTTVTSAAAALPTIQALTTLLNGMVGIAAGVVPPPYGTALAAAAVLLPLVESTVQALLGMIVPPKAAATRFQMTPDDARQALQLIIDGSK